VSNTIGPVTAPPAVHEVPALPPDPVAAHGRFAQKLQELEQLSSAALNPIPAISEPNDGRAAAAKASHVMAVLSNLKGMVHEIETGGANLDKIIAQAASGKDFSNAELLAMQAGMYKYTLTLELLSKVVEQAVSSLKDLLKMQV
jgi:hypothetical protein